MTNETRSRNMAAIKNKDTKIEIKLRKALYARGYRYRKNLKDLPGKPDIVLPKYKTVVFINGCFWHMHKNCKQARLPKSNVDFWKEKLERNVANDLKHENEIRDMGWIPITLWECELEKDFEGVMNRFIAKLVL